MIAENMKNISSDVTIDNTEILSNSKDLTTLRNVIAKNLGRVLVRF